MKHILSLEIPQTYNPKLLLIQDTSQYATSPKVDCGRLEIAVPGYNIPVIIQENKNFNLALTACDLNIQLTDCSTYQADLPDGVYVIRYAVSPLDKVYVEYNHLRVTAILNSYYQLFSQIRLEPCSPGDEVTAKLKELTLIRNFIEAAKAKVEWAQEAEAGMALYNYANYRLGKLAKQC